MYIHRCGKFLKCFLGRLSFWKGFVSDDIQQSLSIFPQSLQVLNIPSSHHTNGQNERGENKVGMNSSKDSQEEKENDFSKSVSCLRVHFSFLPLTFYHNLSRNSKSAPSVLLLLIKILLLKKNFLDWRISK